jgi:hypothetical protein
MDYLDGLTSIVALSWLALLCLLGVFHDAFEDNLLQRVGMAGLALWSVSRVWEKLQTWDTPAIHMVLHVALALYATGTALKVARRHWAVKRSRGTEARELRRGEQHQVAGGKQ